MIIRLKNRVSFDVDGYKQIDKCNVRIKSQAIEMAVVEGPDMAGAYEVELTLTSGRKITTVVLNEMELMELMDAVDVEHLIA